MGKIWTANEIWTLIFAKASRDITINMYLNTVGIEILCHQLKTYVAKHFSEQQNTYQFGVPMIPIFRVR